MFVAYRIILDESQKLAVKTNKMNVEKADVHY